MTPASQTILLLRISRLGLVDPLAELDNVIAKRGEGWFGKVGRRISENTISRMGGIPMPVLISVLYKPPKGAEPAQRYTGSYTLLQYSTHAPRVGEFPSYYGQFMSSINTWLKLEPAPPIELDSLITKSSGEKATNTMRNSMASFFFTRRRSG
jgi:hypothetical protein